MRDIFICPHGNMLENWIAACPKALVSVSVATVPVNEPVIFWLHANANSRAWLEKTMADINKKFQVSKIVVLANTPNQTEALAVLSNGAAGYCHAYSPKKVLTELKTVVTHGGVWLGNDLLKTLIGVTKDLVGSSSSKVEEALALLTKREKETALHAATGLSNKEIARKLDITERTVKAHMSSTLGKLGVKDRLQLALVLNEKSIEPVASHHKVKTLKPKKSSKPARASKRKASTDLKSKKKLELAA